MGKKKLVCRFLALTLAILSTLLPLVATSAAAAIGSQIYTAEDLPVEVVPHDVAEFEPLDDRPRVLSATEVTYAVDGGNLYFDTATGTITDCDVRVTQAAIPETIQDIAVTAIGDYTFSNCNALVSVGIPNSVTFIGADAFYSCERLESINVDPGNLTYSSIDGVLLNKDKTTLHRYPCGRDGEYTIPDSVTTIGYAAFSYCNGLTGVTISDSVTTIERQAFFACDSLANVTIPNSVTTLGRNTFQWCDSLTGVILGNSLTAIEDYTFYSCMNLTSVTIPDSVTTIGESAFNWCNNLTNVDIPDSVTTIGDSAFAWCSSLTSVDIPDSVTTIGLRAFADCDGLISVFLGSGVTSVESGAFSPCRSLNTIHVDLGNPSYSSINGVLFNKSETTLYMFPGGRDGNYIIPGGVTTIGNDAFSGCSGLTSVTIPDSVTTIGDAAFANCSSLTGVTIPDSVSIIEDYTFYSCDNLTSIDIPDSVTTIGDSAFAWCANLTNVTVPDSVTTIGDWAFMSCLSLSSVEIPDSVTTIGDGAFAGCDDLISVYYAGTEEKWNSVHIGSDNEALFSAMIRYVVTGSDGVDDYTQAPQTYYNRGSHFFRVFVYGDHSYPQASGFTITIGDDIYNTGSTNYLRVNIPENFTGDVTVSREDCYTYVLPGKYVGKSNEIMLYRVQGESTFPVIQSLIQKDARGGVHNCLTSGYYPIYENDITPSYWVAQVDWLGQDPGEIWLQQGNRRVDMADGTTGQTPLGLYFTADGGTIYLCAKNGKGEVTQVITSLDVQTRSQSFEVDMGEPQSVTSPETIDFLANTKLEFDLPGIFDAEFEFEEDGTFTVLLGLESKNKAYHKQAVEALKDLLETVESGGVGADVDGMLEQYAREYGLVPSVESAKFSISLNLSVYGYLEGYIAMEDGSPVTVITDGGCLVRGSAGACVTKLFPNGMYGEVGLNNTLQFKMTWMNNLQQPTQVKNSTSVKVGTGVGIPDILSVGVSGVGSLNVELELPLSWNNWDLYTTYELLFCEISVIGDEFSIYTKEGDKFYWIKDGELVMAEESGGGGSRAATGQDEESSFALGAANLVGISLPSLAQEEHTPSPIPRDYLARRVTAPLQAKSAGGTPLQANVYPGSEVRMAALPDGSLLAVWVDDPGRELRPLATNRTALHYAVWRDGIWSEPALVEDDGTADISPVLRVLDGTAYLLWMNADQIFEEENLSAAETAPAMDIRFASFDPNSGIFTDFATVSTEKDGVLDMLPDLLLTENGAAAVWLSEESGDIYSRSGNGKLYAAFCMDGQWTDPQLVVSGLCGVDSLSADSSSGSNSAVWYSAGNPDNPSAKELYRISFFWDGNVLYAGEPHAETVNTVADTKPYWIEDGGLFYYSNNAIQTPSGTVAGGMVTDRFRIASGKDGQLAILYTETDETGMASIYALLRDDGVWSDPIQVVQADNFVLFLDGAFDQDGQLHVLYSSASLDSEGEDGSLTMSTNLYHHILAGRSDLAITRTDYQTASLVPGGELTYFVDVENQGNQAAEYIQIEVFQGETSLGATVFLANLGPGQRQLFSGQCTLPEDFAANSLTVTVTELAKIDENPANNTAVLPLYLDDLSIQQVDTVWQGEQGTMVSAIVTNYGLTTADNLEVRLLNEAGDTIDIKSVPSLTSGGMEIVEFFPVSLVPDQLYEVVITPQSNERSIADNRYPFRALVQSEGISLSRSTCQFGDDVITLSSSVENNCESSISSVLVAALYNEDKLVETELMDITVLGYSTEQNTIVFENPGSDCTVKLFYLEPVTYAPLTQAAIFQSDYD